MRNFEESLYGCSVSKTTIINLGKVKLQKSIFWKWWGVEVWKRTWQWLLILLVTCKQPNSDKLLTYGHTDCILTACTYPIGNRPFLIFFFTSRRTYSEDEAFCLQTANTLKGHVTNLHKNQPSPTLVITCAILNVVFHLYSCFHCKSLPRSKIHPFFLGDSIFFIIW